LDIDALGYGQIYKTLCGKTSNKTYYEITIGNFLTRTCMDFGIMISIKLIEEMGEMGAM
jgi:hypothetical protein